tara:strand:- start:188 stop:697 length:510 start_codon:yes stop_codon:yes gene_type:complete
MGEKTFKIERYYDSVPPYWTAIKGSERDNDKEYDVSYSNDHFELESSNPADSIPVATFLRNEKLPYENIKKEYYYVCEFKWQPYRKIKEFKTISNYTMEGPETIETSHILFFLYWDEYDDYWTRLPTFACRYASSHKEAAKWMLKEITIEGDEAHEVDHFKNGTLEILI